MEKQYLTEAARALDAKLPDNHGFLLLVKAFGSHDPVVYVSSVKREDAIKLLKEFLFRIGEGEDWMKHIN